MLYIVYIRALETTLLFARVNVSNVLPSECFESIEPAVRLFKFSCPRASTLLRALGEQAGGISQVPAGFLPQQPPTHRVSHCVLVLYSHPRLKANCFSLTDINQYSANVMKPEA